jgi:putative ABC transport system substrate-binding protein
MEPISRKVFVKSAFMPATSSRAPRPPALAVVQSTRFKFVINLQTARLLSINVPPQLLAIADEVIE